MKKTIFVKDIMLTQKPDWANVVCYNPHKEIFCYAFQDESGVLNTGYELESGIFCIQLNPDIFSVVERLKTVISFSNYLLNTDSEKIADYQEKLNSVTDDLSVEQLKKLSLIFKWFHEESRIV